MQNLCAVFLIINYSSASIHFFLAFLNLRHFLKIKKKFIQQKGRPRPPRPTPKSAPATWANTLQSLLIKKKILGINRTTCVFIDSYLLLVEWNGYYFILSSFQINVRESYFASSHVPYTFLINEVVVDLETLVKNHSIVFISKSC